jgi:hypothetical protein
MTKMVSVFGLIAVVLAGQAHADALTPLRKIRLMEIRESGFHSVYLKRAKGTEENRDFPNENCDLVDRGVIDENTAFGSTLLSTAMIAYLELKKIKVKVQGCETINGPNSLTAPRIVKIELHTS